MDSCVCGGYEFPPQYDSAASLLIAYGTQWDKVLGIMDRALGEYIVGGIKTTIPFHRQIIRHPRFRSGDYDTKSLILKTFFLKMGIYNYFHSGLSCKIYIFYL